MQPTAHIVTSTHVQQQAHAYRRAEGQQKPVASCMTRTGCSHHAVVARTAAGSMRCSTAPLTAATPLLQASCCFASALGQHVTTPEALQQLLAQHASPAEGETQAQVFEFDHVYNPSSMPAAGALHPVLPLLWLAAVRQGLLHHGPAVQLCSSCCCHGSRAAWLSSTQAPAGPLTACI